MFVQDGFHGAHQEPMKFTQIGPECCDKCLTGCSEFRLKIEGCAVKDFKIDFNITQVCTASQTAEDKANKPAPPN